MTTQNVIGATSAIPQVLVSKQIESSQTTQLTAAASTSLRILSASLCNTSGSPVVVSVNVVKNGSSAATSNRVISGYSLAAGDTTILSELVGLGLGPGDFISTVADTASAVTLVISGLVFS